MKLLPSRVVLALAALGMSLVAPLSPGALAQDDAALDVVASFSILADWVGNVGGQDITVTSIVPADGDAHTFDPDPSVVASIAEADVIFTIGPGFDGWMEDVIEASGTDATVVVLLDHLEERGDLSADRHEDHDDHGASEGHHDHDDDGHDHGDVDPHIWGDVTLAGAAVDVIAETLASADPDHAATYEQHAVAYHAELDELDAWIHEQVATIPADHRKLVTSHDTFGYYADAYGFEVIGTALGSISTEGGDPSAADIAELVGQIEDAGVPAIFAENVMNPDLMQALADEAGVELAPSLYSDALSEADGNAGTYIDMMRFNTTTIVTALGDG
jgi:zinc/manganese transport system substrate-binding protein